MNDISIPPPADPTPSPAIEPAAPAPSPVITDADIAKYEQEFLKDSKLSEGSIKELAGKGLSSNLIEDFIEGRKARAEIARQKIESTVFEVSGGKDGWDKVRTWASTNLSEDDKRVFEQAVTSGDAAAIKAAATAIKARYTDAVGNVSSLARGGASGANEVFRDRSELVAAMKDPRYAKSPAFRAEIDRKIEQTLAAGVDL
jgi:hypothetical protein